MALDLTKHRDELLFVPLGGSDEIGMNLNLYHYQGKWLMVDFGIGFAEGGWLPGVDVLVPDISFLQKIKHDMVGLVLTHAHEDHLGASPYYWDELECPVYATPFTAAFLRAKLMGEGVSKKGKAEIREVQLGSTLDLGPFSLELIGLTHSIPEMQALAIGTDKGTILHTGDWKFDPDPQVGEASDEKALAKYGDQGVLAMVCDSTNVFVKGRSGSESTVRENLVKEIKSCKGRVIATTFASNVARLETICEAARQTGRKIVLAGRSLWRITESAKAAGYLTEYEFHAEADAGKIARDKLLVICTGCQGEPFAALPKIARGDHHQVKITPGDTVIFSSRMIPGNEKRINFMQNMLLRKGIEVVTDKGGDIHVSGHPARDELADMYRLVKPHIAVPVHGEARHIHEHAHFARSMQVPVALEPYNGAVLRLSKENPAIIGEVPSGYKAIDGQTLLDVDSPVLRMRRRLQDAGVLCVTLVVDAGYNLLAVPSVQAPGSLDPDGDFDFLESLREEVEIVMENPTKAMTEQKVKQAVRTAIRRVFKHEIGKKPVILVDVLTLN